MKPLHIAIIARGLPSPEYKLTGIFEYDYAKAFVKAGVKVSLLAVDLRSILRKRKLGIESYEKDGISITSINWPVGNIPKKLFYAIGYKALKKAYRIMVEKDGVPDLLHTFFTDHSYLGALLKKETGLPLFICEPNSHINTDPIRPSLYKAAKEAYHTADVVQAVSPVFQRRLKQVFEIDNVYIPILPDLKIFRYREGERKKRIASTGRVTRDKGMRELIEAFLRIQHEFPDYRLDIFGDGDEREELEALVKKAHAQEAVIFHGEVERKELSAFYDEACMFALCSHHETFGLSYFEAWGSGLPVVSTRCGGPEHAFTEENGILVEVGNVQEIAEALSTMLHNIDRYDRAQISEEAHREFSEERIIGEILRMYEQMIEGNDQPQ